VSRVTRALARRIALGLMVFVTAWSVWSVWSCVHARPAAAAEGKEAAAAGGKHEANGEAKTGGEEEEGPKPFNLTEFGTETPPFIAMLINFGLLAGGYYFLGRKPIAAGLQSRRDTISKDIEEAQRMKHEAEERAKTYQHKLEQLEGELRSARESLVNAGEAEGERIVREAELKADRMRKDAEFMVEQEIKQLRGDLWRETVEAAVAAAEELLKKRVTPADQERLAEDYLADLGGKPKATSLPAARSVFPPAGSGQGGAS
jgi:F0F1-type ATP synthase membrane subunit b/b'